jgi:DNA-binding MarR family transcriptional regulator
MLDVSVATEVIVTLFPEIYLRFHVRRSKRGRRLDTTATAVLTHLESAGPLTIGEAARHLKRSQSVISEIVSRLERQGLLERMRDERDRRRVLVWVTPSARLALADNRQVLAPALLAPAVARMSPAERKALVSGMRALIAAARSTGSESRAQHP